MLRAAGRGWILPGVSPLFSRRGGCGKMSNEIGLWGRPGGSSAHARQGALGGWTAMRRAAVFVVAAVTVLSLASCRGKAGESKPVLAKEAAVNRDAAQGRDVFRCQGAGQWFPAAAEELKGMVDGFLAKAKKQEIPGKILGLIAPHAGYVFSGQVAASAYKQLEGTRYDTVVVVGFTHHQLYQGISVLAGPGAYETPLGAIPIDADISAELLKQDKHIVSEPGLFRGEHSMENQLPFLQRTLPPFKLVAVLIGDETPENSAILAGALAAVLKGRNALVVASSDMSHFWTDEEARRLDAETLAHIRKYDFAGVAALLKDDASGRRLCGHGAVVAVMDAVKRLGADEAHEIVYANSADVTGDKSRVVGYGAVALTASKQKPVPAGADEKQGEKKETSMENGELDRDDRALLLKMARESLESHLQSRAEKKFEDARPNLELKRGVFVTLKEHGELRGCIGHFEQDVTLRELVPKQTMISATQDPRFPPVTARELGDIKIEISVLSEPKPVASWQDIDVGRHGVILRKGMRGATFLPQVAPEQGWDREQMLSHLAQKAGLPPDAWKEGATFFVYTAQVFGEQ